MARVIDARIEALPDHGPGAMITWEGLDAGDVGSWVTYPQYQYKTVSVDGEGELRIGATNAPHDRNADPFSERIWPIRNKQDGALITGAGLYVLQENTLRIRPQVLVGGPITVRVVATR